MADATWFVGRGGERKGPFSQEDMLGMVARGELGPSDLVWREGMADWKPLGEVPELQPPSSAAPASPPPAADAAWFVGRGGRQLGPYSTAEVVAMAARGEVTRSDLVWKEGMANWQPVSAIPEFAAVAKAGPPGPPPIAPGAPAGPSPAAMVFASLLADLKAILADPDRGLKEAADRKAVVNSCVWIGILAVVTGLLGLQVAASIPFMPGGEVVKAFFKWLLSSLVAQGVLFGALYLTLGPILNATSDWKASLAITGLFAIPLALVGIVVFILAWLTFYAQALWAGGLPMAVLVLYETFLHVSNAQRRVALIAIPAICLATAIVFGILMRILAV